MIVKLKSTDLNNNVRNRLFLSDIEPITVEQILKVKSLNINRIGFGLKENVFAPEELKFFENLEVCEFTGMKITDEIIEAFKSLRKLKVLSFDHCVYKSTQKMDCGIEKFFLLNSNFRLIDIVANKENLRFIQIQNVPEQVDIERILDAKNLEDLRIYDSDIINVSNLERFVSLRTLSLDGSKFDDENSINSLGIEVSQNENFYYRG